MKKSDLFNVCLSEVPRDVQMQISLSFDISDKIASLLKSNGMTQKDLARKMQKSESEVSRWLSGTHNFKLSTLAKISDVLGCDFIRVV